MTVYYMELCFLQILRKSKKRLFTSIVIEGKIEFFGFSIIEDNFSSKRYGRWRDRETEPVLSIMYCGK
jgi:hypothetical protein